MSLSNDSGLFFEHRRPGQEYPINSSFTKIETEPLIKSDDSNLAFGRQGRFHDRGYEAQLNRASALSLVINAIAVWNTRYFERAEAKLTRQQIPLPEEVWQHLSPFQWSHIHLNGSYHFTGLALKDDFRPLREYQGPRAYLSPGSQNSETEATVSQGVEEAPLPIQLSFLAEGEQD